MGQRDGTLWRCILRAHLVAAVGLVLSLAFTVPPARAADDEALVKAAKAEGAVTWYVSVVDEIARRIDTAFKEKYGITVSRLRLPGPTLVQRFSAEAESGKFAADVLVGTIFSTGLANTLIAKGWVEPIGSAGIPALQGEYPQEHNEGPGRFLGTSPWQIGVNTQRVKPHEIPKTWNDLLNARWKGRLIAVDPGASPDTYFPFWAMLEKNLGSDFLKALQKQEIRIGASLAPAVQSLAAGEGDLALPVYAAIILPLKAKGAPVDLVTIAGPTTGNAAQIIITKLDKTPHPNAARLFASFLLSKEGNTIFNGEPGQAGPYSMKDLPAGYQPPQAIDNLDHRVALTSLITGK